MGIFSFKRGIEPKRAMETDAHAVIQEWLEKHEIKKYTITDDLQIDVDGDVWLYGYHINDVAKIPNDIKFRNVKGKFILTNTGFIM